MARKITFEIPTEFIIEFSEKSVELQVENKIIGTTDHDEVEIEISYDKSENDEVEQLEEFFAELTGEESEEN